MQVAQLEIPEVLLIEPRLFEDDRGFFFESFNKARFAEAVGGAPEFVQDNHSRSQRGVLRGLHYQLPPRAQGKLVRAVVGEIYDVAVDIRRASATFGCWVGMRLSAENRRQLWIPPGFAHGFVALSDHAELLYKTTDFYAPELERCVIWNDPDLAIRWPVPEAIRLSPKDEAGRAFARAELFG